MTIPEKFLVDLASDKILKALIRAEGSIPRPLGRNKGFESDCDTFREQHTPLLVAGLLIPVNHPLTHTYCTHATHSIHFYVANKKND